MLLGICKKKEKVCVRVKDRERKVECPCVYVRLSVVDVCDTSLLSLGTWQKKVSGQRVKHG